MIAEIVQAAEATYWDSMKNHPVATCVGTAGLVAPYLVLGMMTFDPEDYRKRRGDYDFRGLGILLAFSVTVIEGTLIAPFSSTAGYLAVRTIEATASYF